MSAGSLKMAVTRFYLVIGHSWCERLFILDSQRLCAAPKPTFLVDSQFFCERRETVLLERARLKRPRIVAVASWLTPEGVVLLLIYT